MLGPMVALTNEFAGSDGDIFSHGFKLLKLGPLIGKRTWGGVVGIRGDKKFIDGGSITEPEFAWWDPQRGWSIENHGVDPDIEVDYAPADYLANRDPQLERGLEELTKQINDKPVMRPAPPPFPAEKMRQQEQPRQAADTGRGG